MIIQLCLSRPNELSRAQNFNELWSRMTNDEIFQLEWYYKIVIKSEISIARERSGEVWERLREVIKALGFALSYINKELLARGRETLEATSPDDAAWVLNLPTRAANADELRHHGYAQAMAQELAEEIMNYASGVSRYSGSDMLNPLILFTYSTN